MTTPYLIKQALDSLKNIQPTPEVMFTNANLLTPDLGNLIIGGHYSLPLCPVLVNGRIELSMHYSCQLQKPEHSEYQAWYSELSNAWLASYHDASNRLRMMNLGGQSLCLFLPIQLNSQDFQDSTIIDLSIFTDRQVRAKNFQSFLNTLASPLPFFPGNDFQALTEALGNRAFSMSFGQVILGVFSNSLSQYKVNHAITFLVVSDSQCPGVDFIGRLLCLFFNGQVDYLMRLNAQGMKLFSEPQAFCNEWAVWILINALPLFLHSHLVLTDFIESLSSDEIWETNQSAKNIHMIIQHCLRDDTFLAYCGKIEKLQSLQNTLCRIIEQTERKVNEQYFWWLNPGNS